MRPADEMPPGRPLGPLWKLSDDELALASAEAVNASLSRLCGQWMELFRVWKLALPAAAGTGWLLAITFAANLPDQLAFAIGAVPAIGGGGIWLLRIIKLDRARRADLKLIQTQFDPIQREAQRRLDAIDRRPVH